MASAADSNVGWIVKVFFGIYIFGNTSNISVNPETINEISSGAIEHTSTEFLALHNHLLLLCNYVAIRKSSQNIVKDNKQLQQRTAKRKQKIALIITTDFCCWSPFIVICA